MILIHTDSLTARCNDDNYLVHIIGNGIGLEIPTLNVALRINMKKESLMTARKLMNYIYLNNSVHISPTLIIVHNKLGDDKLHKDWHIEIKHPIIYNLDVWREFGHINQKEI
jgi:hypothetical protein